MDQALVSLLHTWMGNLYEVLGSWLPPNLAPAGCGNWGSQSADRRFLCVCAFLPLSPCLLNK